MPTLTTPPRKVIYLIGSLRNPQVTEFANVLERATGYEVFASWMAAGPIADDSWRDYENARGRGVREALTGYAARHVFGFDKYHLDRADAAVLLMPAGKSGHMELGYTIGKDKPGFIVFDAEPERYDVMWNFASGIAFTMAELVPMLKRAVG